MGGISSFSHLATGVAAIALVASAGPAMAQVRSFNVPAGPASETIPLFARQAGTQIIGNANDLRGKRTNALKGTYSLEEGLSRLLAGTGLNRIPSDGDVVAVGLVQRGNAQAGTAAAQAEDDADVPEVLVIGRRSRNADIRRTENDAQPYVVFDRRDIEQSQAITVEDFLRTRLPQNAGTFGAQSQETGRGSPFSSFNLRGLGTDQTLILVNGRRLPTLNRQTEAPGQADINGIPVGSIERIEVLPSSAGGIYGGNAVGGVINIILRNDYRGIDLTATYNDTLDFEVPSVRLDVNGGFALEGGRTTVTFGGSLTRSGTLLVGERLDLFQRGVDRYRDNVDIFAGTGFPPFGNGVNIRSATNANLVLDPQFGGTNLGSRFTNIPLGYGGVASDNGALLVANAGTFNLDVPDDLNGRRRGLLTSPDISSGNINIRRTFADWMDLVVDYGHFENAGTSFSVNSLRNSVTLPAAAPNNPFQQAIRVTFPLPDLSFPFRSESNTDTFSLGSIVRLPYRWGLSLEYNKTWTDTRTTGFIQAIPNAVVACLTSGAATCQGGPGLNPLRPPIDFGPFLYDEPTIVGGPFRSTFTNPIARASGPLFKLPGGEANLTLAVQQESTELASSVLETSDGTVEGRYYTFYQPREQSTTSAYGELAVPLVSPSMRVPLIWELELRGALRHDSYRTEAPPAGFTAIDYIINGTPISQPGGLEQVLTSNPNVEIPSYTPVESRFKSTNFTLAGRYSPTNGLVFRASYATGFLPPNVVQIASTTITSPNGLGVNDPLRGNEFVNYPAQFVQGGGNVDLKPEKSTTLSFGAIVTPVRGLRFSADYTRIKKRDEIGAIPITFLLANPDLFPGRVVRGPASDGFAVGRIISLDVTPVNLLRSLVQAVDFQADYRFDTQRYGEFRLYGVATWQPDSKSQLIVEAPSLNFTGNAGGPLEWQGNVGVDWQWGRLGLQWNTQFYDSYNVALTTDSPEIAAIRERDQGATRIPSQSYSDFLASYDFGDREGPLSGLRLSAGIQNVFNAKPPVIAISGFFQTPYSTFGDPRLRRFTISVRKSFGSTKR